MAPLESLPCTCDERRSSGAPISISASNALLPCASGGAASGAFTMTIDPSESAFTEPPGGQTPAPNGVPLSHIPHCKSPRTIVQSARAATRTAVFFLKVLPMSPSRPVDWITPKPVVSRVHYPGRLGEIEADLYRPST